MLLVANQMALAFLAAILLPVGIGHVMGMRGFVQTVRGHRVVPEWLALPVAIAVVAFELGAGGFAVGRLMALGAADWEPFLFAGCGAMGLLFAAYIRLLLSRPSYAGSCGCSPFRSRLSPASMLPSLSLVAFSLLGLITRGLGSDPLVRSLGVPALASELAIGWSLTLAAIVFLIPATLHPALTEVEP